MFNIALYKNVIIQNISIDYKKIKTKYLIQRQKFINLV